MTVVRFRVMKMVLFGLIFLLQERKRLRLFWFIALLPWIGACSFWSADTEKKAGPDLSSMNEQETLAHKEGLLLYNFDLNRDGTTDLFKFYKEEATLKAGDEPMQLLVRKEVDLNHDGKIDMIRVYDETELVAEEHTDLDFDGKFDEVSFFKDGVILKKLVDLDYDGDSEVSKFYKEGKLIRVESDRDNDGRIDTWEYFENNEVTRMGIDTTGDGKVDTWDRKKESPKE